MEPNWSNLLHDLLVIIAARIALFEDLAAFGSVCTSWRSASLKVREKFNGSVPQVPWLMLAEDFEAEQETTAANRSRRGRRRFYNLSKGITHEVELPEASGKWCLSSHGWLITAAEDAEGINLLHPLSRAQIRLPEVRTSSNPDRQIHKMVFSDSPSRTLDFVVMVIHSMPHRVSFCRPGDLAWTRVENCRGIYFDIIHYRGKFYTVDCLARILVFDVDGPNPTRAEEVPFSMRSNEPYPSIPKLYLVESEGKLLMVWRDIEDRYESYETTLFRVFELVESNGNWPEIRSLGNRALFLGFNSSFSVEAINGCKPDSIYFTDDCHEYYKFEDVSPLGGGADMGVYSMLDGKIEPHFHGKSFSRLTPPTWVIPSFS